MILMFIADGFEEIEALTTLDILRRAELNVKTVSVGKRDRFVTGAHGVTIKTELMEGEVDIKRMVAAVLPGGPGVANLDKSPVVKQAITNCIENNITLAAICAAPAIPGRMGVLKGKKVTCYPGFEQELYGANVVGDLCVRDGNIITAKGPGAAMDFGLAIVEAFRGSYTSSIIRMSIQYRSN